nr:MAG TPA: hypothetical protein [Caudoviricetes sp.]
MTTDYQGFKRDTDLAVEKIRTGAMTMAQGAGGKHDNRLSGI